MNYTATFTSPRATTDPYGRFAIKDVPPATYALKFRMSFLRVKDADLNVVIDKNGHVVELGEILVK